MFFSINNIRMTYLNNPPDRTSRILKNILEILAHGRCLVRDAPAVEVPCCIGGELA
jgi:hypothetical protein